MITPAEIQARFPTFAAFDVALLQLCINEAVAEIDETVWGTRYNTGLLYFAAHLASSASAPGGGAVGPLSSKRVGDVSWSYAVPAATSSSSGLDSTNYGKRFKELRSLVQSGPITAMLEEVTVDAG